MVTTIAIIFFVSKLCHLTAALFDSNLIYPSTIGPSHMLTTSSSNMHFTQPNGNQQRPPDIDWKNRHILRDKRNAVRSDKNFVRLGRGGEDYSRYLRSDKNLIRFGRNDNSKGNGFIRFGRSDKGLIRFGRNDNSDSMRFGRRGDKFIRFGRNNGGVDSIKPKDSFLVENNLNAIDNSFQPFRQIMRPGRTDKYIRFGRGDNGFLRFGKKDDESKYVQDGGSATSNDLDSEEKVESGINDDDSIPVSMHLYNMLRKNDELMSGIDNVSPSPTLDDDYPVNFRLNYDNNSLKTNLL